MDIIRELSESQIEQIRRGSEELLEDVGTAARECD